MAAAMMPPAAMAEDSGVTPLLAAPSQLRSDSAYILLRSSAAKSGVQTIYHVFLRVPSAQELEEYRTAKKAAYAKELPVLTRKAKDGKVPTIDEFAFDFQGRDNAFLVHPGRFLEGGEMNTILLQAPPGKYILYGVTMGGRVLITCNCLGTVAFHARAGVITDIGSLYADKVHRTSPIPHLEDNLGPKLFQYGVIFGQGLVPPDGSTPVPTALRGFPVEPAQLEVVGQFYENGAPSINRLAPIPGSWAMCTAGRWTCGSTKRRNSWAA